MVGVSLGEHKPLEALSIMLKHLGGEVHIDELPVMLCKQHEEIKTDLINKYGRG